MRNCLIAMVSLSFIVSSCTKGVIYEADTVKPQIRIVYPSDNPIIPAGFPLCMQVMISDNISLSKVWLQVNDGAGFKKDYKISGRMMSITEKYTASPGTSGQLIAKFFAMDEGGNLSSEEIKFGVNY